jgi:hypothetical protein
MASTSYVRTIRELGSGGQYRDLVQTMVEVDERQFANLEAACHFGLVKDPGRKLPA